MFDTLGFRDVVAPGTSPARMAPATAISFVFIAVALLLQPSQRHAFLTHALLLLAALNGSLGLARYIFGGETWLPFQLMAVHTSACFVILSVGLLSLQPADGLLGLVMSDRARASFSRRTAYGIGIILTAMTLLIRGAIGSGFNEPTIIVFTVPIILAAYWGGLGPGLASTALSALLAAYFVLPPLSSFNVFSATHRWQELVLCLSGVLISVICELLHRSRRKAEAVVADLKNTQADLKAALKDANELRAALDEHAIVAVTDPSGRINFVNEKFCTISKYTRNELLGQDHRLINSGFHSKDFIRNLWTTIGHGKVWQGEIKNRTKDGSYYWVATTIVPFLKENGKPRQYVAIRADITERKHAEEEVREGQAQLQAVVENLTEGLIICDQGGQILLWNRAALTMHGFRGSEHAGGQLSEFARVFALSNLDGSSLTFEQWPLPRILAGELVRDFVVRVKRIDANWQRIFNYNGTLVRSPGGKELAFISVSDITEKHHAQAELRASEERFRELAENIQEVFWILDPAQKKFLYVSPPYASIWGRSCQSLYDAPGAWLEAVHPEDRPRVSLSIAALETNPTYDESFRILRPDGSLRWIRNRAFQVRNKAGHLERIVGVAEDVTNHRKLEEQLRQAQKMEAIGQLAGGIAHDFNNILTAINGNATLALYEVPTDHSARPCLIEIQKAGLRAADLVRRILTFSRQQTPERKFVTLPPIIREAIQLLRSTLPAMIDIRTDLQGESLTILADPTQIHQVIMNLGTNALHAMGEKGVLEFRLTVAEVDEDLAQSSPDLRKGRFLRLSVSDSGCGMDRSTLDRIFEPFFTTKPQGQGTGMGLSVVHGIMKAHDGAITVYSELGKGTAFQLYFPVIQAPSIESTTSAPPMSRGEGQHILYVDDEMPLVFLATRMLERLGYTVSGFDRPEAALAAFREAPERFDLVITDVSMPGLTGPELVQQIRQIRTDIPIIMATGYVRPGDQEKALSIGVRDLMLKPNTIEEMGETLSKLLSKT